MTIELGCCDSTVSTSAWEGYLKTVKELTNLAVSEVIGGPADKIAFKPYTPEAQAMTVAQVQSGLKQAGFFPAGKVDGICGYRTQSALRLFQEYVRTYGKEPSMTPDGKFGPKSQEHLRRWLAENRKSEWTPVMDAWLAGTVDGDYARWLAWLDKVKQRYLAQPAPALAKVRAATERFGSYRVDDWNFSPKVGAQLIGIRREEADNTSDDAFVLLVKGLVFMFQGTTEPGETKDARGYPFLLIGQHDYQFGFHRKTYLALKPLTKVLVVRWRDRVWNEQALDNPLEGNDTINIHWGGRGLRGLVNGWSEGCQVITGSVYMNPRKELIDCRAFMGVLPDDPIKDDRKTRGAYNVLVDLVTALSSDQSATVKYTMLPESDLDLDPELKTIVADARTRVLAVG